MSEGAIGMLVLLTISVVMALFIHWRCRRFFVASFLSMMCATILFFFLTYLHDGQLDKFFAIAAVVAGGIALSIALVIGVVIQQFRKPSERVPRKPTDYEEEQL